MDAFHIALGNFGQNPGAAATEEPAASESVARGKAFLGAIRVIKWLSINPGRFTADEVAIGAELSRSGAHKVLNELVDQEVVKKTKEGQGYAYWLNLANVVAVSPGDIAPEFRCGLYSDGQLELHGRFDMGEAGETKLKLTRPQTKVLIAYLRAIDYPDEVSS